MGHKKWGQLTPFRKKTSLYLRSQKARTTDQQD